MTPDDFAAVVGLARALPAWFNDDGIAQIAEAVHHEKGAVAEAGGAVVGFVTWYTHDDGVGEIGWIAVSAGRHRGGIGRRLLEVAEDDLRDSGVTEVLVETLGESVEYEPYERTRAFYRALGFRDFKQVMMGNPGVPESLTLKKRLSPSHG